MSIVLHGLHPISFEGLDWQDASASWAKLWSFCYVIAPDLISERQFRSGLLSNGVGLDSYIARELAGRVSERIAIGQVPDELHNFCLSCFANFLEQSGGFEIW